LRRDQLHAGPQPRLDLTPQCCEPFRRDEVGLVQDHEIGAGQLIGKDLLERIVVVDRGIGGAHGTSPWAKGPRRATASGSLAKRPSAAAAASMTVTTPSTVMRVRISGQA